MKNLIFKALRLTGLHSLFRRCIQKKKVTIIAFHNISPACAEEAFTYLKAKYAIIPLRQYLKAVQTKNPGLLPPYALIITLDDGYKENYQLIPVLKKYQIPATFFVTSDIVGTNKHFWFKDAESNLQLKKRLKKITNKSRLMLLEKNNLLTSGSNSERQALSKEELNELKEWADIQSHTQSHPCLPYCTTEEAGKEIMQSKRDLEDRYGLSIYALAYPNGDYSERDIALARQAGYTCGLTISYGFNSLTTDPFRIKRLPFPDKFTLDELIVKSSGVWGFIRLFIGEKEKYGFHTRSA